MVHTGRLNAAIAAGVLMCLVVPGKAHSQSSDHDVRQTETALLRDDQLAGLLTDLVAALPNSDARSLEPKLTRIQELRSGETTTIPLVAEPADTSRLVMEVLNDGIAKSVTIRGRGHEFEVADSIFMSRWRGTLSALGDRVQLGVGDVVSTPGSHPAAYVTLTTEKMFSCTGHVIIAEDERIGNRLYFDLLGVTNRGSICGQAITPATSRWPLPSEPGTYSLMISHDGRTDEVRISIADSMFHLLPGERSFVVTSDSTLVGRRVPMTFAFHCSVGAGDANLCRDVVDWVLTATPTVRYRFPTGAWIPYRRTAGTAHEEHHYFLATSGAVFRRIEECAERLSAAVESSVGVVLVFETWDGHIWAAVSQRSNHEQHEEPNELRSACSG